MTPLHRPTFHSVLLKLELLRTEQRHPNVGCMRGYVCLTVSFQLPSNLPVFLAVMLQCFSVIWPIIPEHKLVIRKPTSNSVNKSVLQSNVSIVPLYQVLMINLGILIVIII